MELENLVCVRDKELRELENESYRLKLSLAMKDEEAAARQDILHANAEVIIKFP